METPRRERETAPRVQKERAGRQAAAQCHAMDVPSKSSGTMATDEAILDPTKCDAALARVLVISKV
jgi:hypothetical protein